MREDLANMGILTHLDDPSDVVRVSSVSRLWRQFDLDEVCVVRFRSFMILILFVNDPVIEQGICRQICLKKFPEISGAAHDIEVNNLIEPVNVGLRKSTEFELLKGTIEYIPSYQKGFPLSLEKIAYQSPLVHPALTKSIQNTLEALDVFDNGALYWSSGGESDPSVPETLLYKLVAKLCVITEIHVQHFHVFDPSGRCSLNYHPKTLSAECSLQLSNAEVGESSRLRTITSRFMRVVVGWEHMVLNRYLGSGSVSGDDESEDERLE
ncbi:hypothetical protein PanWU01x14_220820 [Parasponia andersonii]|uniref:F-box domain containing protein n=1 Tax=Parasponia andersonii TaxID=3476 RepID=A0A2P5BPZ6_PARAD|nr:hypothetical protein PanWU01x14_220820 [Parasponia andersonii]